MTESTGSTHDEGDETARPERVVVIFVDAWDSPSIEEHVEAIADAFPHWRITIIQQFPKKRIGKRIRRKISLLGKDPLSFVFQSLGLLARKLTKTTPPRAASVVTAPPLSSPRHPNVTYRSVTWLHGKSSLEFVRSLKPWIGLSIGAPILRPSLFRIPLLGTINIHKSMLPKYKGMPYGFWELNDGVSETGVTTHWVDEGLDTGPIIDRIPHPIPKFATIRGLAAELDLKGTEVLLKTLRDLDENGASTSNPINDVDDSPANRAPSWRQAWSLYRRLEARRTPNSSIKARVRGGLKKLACLAYVRVYAPLRNFRLSRVGHCRTSILLYHRVNDGFLDNVTVGVEQFERQIKMIARHYDVIDLSEFLASRARPRYRPAVVLTFDDGYLDNYLAAILLRREGLPCTFFVSTRIVGTDRAFPHDLKALGYRVSTMSWDQIRRLVAWGFRVSNHTQSHADLGSVGVDTALAEVAGAREDLARELGEVVGLDWLAYPYGQPNNMDEEVRRRLKSLGVNFCMSAHGGTNPIDFDPLDIKRQSVDYRFSEERLRAAIEGWSV